jgi:hypothetical protein
MSAWAKAPNKLWDMCLVLSPQAAKQARDKQLADIVEQAGQRPQVSHATMHAGCRWHVQLPTVLAMLAGPGACIHLLARVRYTRSTVVDRAAIDPAQAGHGMVRIDLREAAVVQNPTGGAGLGDVAEE